MWMVIIPLIILGVIFISVSKAINNMLTFGTKKIVVVEKVENTESKVHKKGKIVKLIIYIVTGISSFLWLISVMNGMYGGIIFIILTIITGCGIAIISYFDSENKNMKR